MQLTIRCQRVAIAVAARVRTRFGSFQYLPIQSAVTGWFANIAYLMKRKNTLDDSVQIEAKNAFRQLRLQINQLLGVYRRHRPQQYRSMPPLDPRVVRTLGDEAKRLRGQLTIWFSVVEGHHPVHLVYAWTKLDRALTVLEVDLEWERQLTVST
jgi:hypothetical protein